MICHKHVTSHHHIVIIPIQAFHHRNRLFTSLAALRSSSTLPASSCILHFIHAVHPILYKTVNQHVLQQHRTSMRYYDLHGAICTCRMHMFSCSYIHGCLFRNFKNIAYYTRMLHFRMTIHTIRGNK